ncbi:MAG: GNAT family N-acetyltransferase [Anaerolineales bacterium]
MDKTSFERLIHENWATYFGCSVETTEQPGTTLLPESKYEGDKVIALWHIGKHTFVQLDPTFHSQLETLTKGLLPHTSLTGEQIETIWGKEALSSRDEGFMYYLFPPDLPNYQPRAPFTIRQLSEADADLMSALQAANTPEDVDEAYVEVNHEIAFGCFHGDQLVAAASGYERTGFLDLGVLTHPDFRKQGLGKAVVGATCTWANQKGIIAQYRHNTLNINSKNVATSLNFRQYFSSEGVFLR